MSGYGTTGATSFIGERGETSDRQLRNGGSDGVTPDSCRVRVAAITLTGPSLTVGLSLPRAGSLSTANILLIGSREFKLVLVAVAAGNMAIQINGWW